MTYKVNQQKKWNRGCYIRAEKDNVQLAARPDRPERLGGLVSLMALYTTQKNRIKTECSIVGTITQKGELKHEKATDLIGACNGVTRNCFC